MELRLNRALVEELDLALSRSHRPNGTVLQFVITHRHSPQAMLAAAVRQFAFNPECACTMAVFASFQMPEVEPFSAVLLADHDVACEHRLYRDILKSGGVPGLREFRLKEYRRAMLAGDLAEADRQWQRYRAILGETMAPTPDLAEARRLTGEGKAKTLAGTVVPRTWEEFEASDRRGALDAWGGDDYLNSHPSKAEYVAAVVRLHGGAPATAVLEFGCANGALTNRIATTLPGVPVIGVDLSQELIAAGRAKFANVELFRCADAGELAAVVAGIQAERILLAASSVLLILSPRQLEATLDAVGSRLWGIVAQDDVMNSTGTESVMRNWVYAAHPFAALARARGLSRIEIQPIEHPGRSYNGMISCQRDPQGTTAIA